MSTRTLLLGDWSPILRDPIDLIRVSFLAGALGFVLAGKGGAAVLGVAGLFTWGVRFLDLPRLFDLCVALALVFAAWGEALRVYDSFPAYDIVTHLLVPFLGAPVIYIALARLEVVPDPADDTTTAHFVGIFVVTFAIGMSVGSLWEILEFTSDRWVGSQLSLGNRDTVGDLVADAFGAVAGGALLVVWTRYGWGSVRRIPGENTREDRNA